MNINGGDERIPVYLDWKVTCVNYVEFDHAYMKESGVIIYSINLFLLVARCPYNEDKSYYHQENYIGY